jgi:ubiquinone/menaquinone biosynthesis C-methylase UbiE
MKFAVAFLLVALAHGQVAQDANKRYQTTEGRSTIAGNLGGHDRESRQKPRELLAALAIQPGSTVCDVGTGVGFLLPYLHTAVGPQGRLIAEDIFPDFLAQAKQRAAQAKLTNVTFVQGTDRDPKLPAKTCDLVLVLDAYHHFDYPAQMLASIKESLTAKGRFALVDFYKRPGAMGPNTDAVQHIRLDLDDVVREVEAQGFKAGSRGEHLPKSQYYVLFTAAP